MMPPLIDPTKIPPKKAAYAIGLYMILEGNYYQPEGFQATYFSCLNDAASMKRSDLYQKLEQWGYRWDGKRWLK